MKKSEVFYIMDNGNIDTDKVSSVESIYEPLPKCVQRLISYSSSDSVFIDDVGRLLAISEIKNADYIYGIDLIAQKLMPIIDCYDNDFLVFNYKDLCWSLYNIVDEIVIKSSKNLNDII